MRKMFAIAALMPMALAACVIETPTPPPGEVPAANACGATGLQWLVGRPVSELNRVQLANQPRILTPGSVMTMDYRAERLNVELDNASRIIRLFCG